jgi:hypothetical protein
MIPRQASIHPAVRRPNRRSRVGIVGWRKARFEHASHRLHSYLFGSDKRLSSVIRIGYPSQDGHQLSFTLPIQAFKSP